MRKLIPFIVGGVIVVGGAAAFFMARDDNPASTTNSGVSQAASESFNMVPNDNVDYKATSTTKTGDKTAVTVIESDVDSGATRGRMEIAGSNISYIYTADAVYTCTSDTSCFKVTTGQAGFNPKDFQYGKEKVGSFKSTSKKLGRKSCPAGTCDVWEVSTDNYKSKIYVDTQTRRVSQAIGQTGEATMTTVYEYIDVTVKVPTNAQELPSGISGQ